MLFPSSVRPDRLRRRISPIPFQSTVWLLLLALFVGNTLGAQQPEGTQPDRGKAYYHFALGHLYHQFAQQFMNEKGEYGKRAIAEYNIALENDPGSILIRIELINLHAAMGQLSDAVEIAEEILAGAPDNLEVRRLLGNILRSFATRDRRGVNQQLLLRSIEQFERIAEIEPDNAENHVQLGILYRTAGQAEGAEKSFRRAVALDPAQADAQVNLAYMLLEARNFDEAITALERIVESDSSNHRYATALADAYQQVGRFREAADQFGKILAAGRNTLELRRRFADNLYLSEQVEEALEQYENLAKTDPENPEFQLRIARIHTYRREFDKAWAALERARRLDRDSLDVQYDTLGLLEVQGRKQEAVTQATDLLKKTQKKEYTPAERRARTELLLRLGSLQRQLDSTQDAIATFQRIADINPSVKVQAIAQIVETWRQTGNYARAEKEARKAADASEDDTVLSDILAGVLSDRGKTREAIKVIERRIKDGKPDIGTLLAIARVYVQGLQFAKAEEHIDQAKALADSEADRIEVLFAYGSMYERAKKFEQSEASFRELLKIDPDNSTALNYLGYMFADRGVHLDEAHDLIQRALDIEPGNGAYLDSLGWLYYRQEKLGLAVEYLERSLNQYGRDPVVHTHLGDVYFKQGRVTDAKKHWSQGLEAWSRSAPADRDPKEMESLRRKLSELELSSVEGPDRKKQQDAVKR